MPLTFRHHDLVPELTSGPSGFRRARVDVGEPGFWLGQQFGVQYEFNIPADGRRVLKVAISGDLLLLSASVSVDAGDLYYRVFGWSDETKETAAFSTSIPIVALNTMTFTPEYTPVTEVSTGGDFDETGLAPFPTARIRTANNSNFRQTAGGNPGTQRGFGPAFAYVVLTTLTSNVVTGVVEYRFEERTWGY